MDNVIPFPGQVDRDGIALNFLAKVLPEAGLYCAAVRKRGQFIHTFHETIESLWKTLDEAERGFCEVYFALASFSDNRRLLETVCLISTLSIDLDCGSQGHSRPHYATVTEARDALRTFCEALTLPMPILILSGGGLHAHWPMKEGLPLAEWQRYAEGLKQACIAHGLKCDHGLTVNGVHIMRPPGTMNRKLEKARPVDLPSTEFLNLGPYDWVSVGVLLGFVANPAPQVTQKATLSPRPAWLGAYEPSEKFPDRHSLVNIQSLIEGCGHVKQFSISGDVPEPEWMLLANLFRYVEGGEQLFHQYSAQGFSRYNRQEAQKKYDRGAALSGPPKCSTFDDDICKACPLHGIARTPLDAVGESNDLPPDSDRTSHGHSSDGKPLEQKLAAFVEWDKTEKGALKPSYKNAAIAIGKLGVTCRHDTFHLKKMINGVANVGPMLDDAACRTVREMIITRYKFDAGKQHIQEALEAACERNPFDPVGQYLDSLVWDGTPRLDYWLTGMLGADRTPLNAAFGRKTLIAAVRRVFKPGCKFDYLLVLEGRQGAGKSTAWRILAGDENFSDVPIRWDDPKAQREAAGGVWIHEIAELVGLRKADVESIKSFLSRQNDRNRAAYDRFQSDQYRRCIFVGTINPVGRYAEYLTDPTGARRFWPVKVGRIDLNGLKEYRDQLWAEATHYHKQGEEIALPRELYEAAQEQQDLRSIPDPWVDMLAHLDGKAVGTLDIFWRELGYDRKSVGSREMARLGIVMRKLGWDGPKMVQVNGEQVKGYTR